MPPSLSAVSGAGGTVERNANETSNDMSYHSCARRVPSTPGVLAYLILAMICRHVGHVSGVIWPWHLVLAPPLTSYMT